MFCPTKPVIYVLTMYVLLDSLSLAFCSWMTCIQHVYHLFLPLFGWLWLEYTTCSFNNLFQVFFKFYLLNKSSLDYSIKIHIYFISLRFFNYLYQIIFSYIVGNPLTWYKMNLIYLWQLSPSKPYYYEFFFYVCWYILEPTM